MRTRHSPRNQEILFKALFKPEPVAVEPIAPSHCWDCLHYPKGGRSRGRCALLDKMVEGMRQKECFVLRDKKKGNHLLEGKEGSTYGLA